MAAGQSGFLSKLLGSLPGSAAHPMCWQMHYLSIPGLPVKDGNWISN
jgi:hypothetical protein